MNNSLTFILKLQDMLTPGMRQAANISNSSAAKITHEFEKINQGGRRMAASVDELRSRLAAINKVRFSTTVKHEFDVATKAANRLEREIEKIENKGRRQSGGGLGRLIGGAALGYGIAQAGRAALMGSAQREQQQIAFGVMTGSQETGNKMVSDLVKMGNTTPYESVDLIKNAQTLKAFGIENEKILPTLRNIGDIAAGDAQKLQSLSLAFAQTSSAGKLTGQDMLQMVNAGFNPLQQMVRDKVFPSLSAARSAMEKGAIGANMVEAAFKSATGPGGQFHKMMEKQSATLSGRWSTFMDAVQEKLIALGNILKPIASALLDFGSALLSGQPWAIALASAIGILTLSITWASIQTTLFTAAAKSATFFTGLWNGAQALLNATFWANPITWIIALIVGLIGVIAYVMYTTDGWGKQWDNLIKFFRASWNAYKEFFNLTWLTMQDSFLTGIELIKKAWFELKALWDKDGAAAGLASINSEQNKRAAEIAKSRGVLQEELNKAIALSQSTAITSNGKSLSTIIPDIKKKLGMGAVATVDPTTANMSTGAVDYGIVGGAGGGLGKGSGSARSSADSINSGGQRSIVINIAKQIEKLEQHIVGGSRETADEIEAAVREAMRRVMYSVNGVAS